jgi:chemotaxis regulatin CheY-phosphate phosphatase CheZ
MTPELASPTREEVMADTQETLRAVARALDALGPTPDRGDNGLAAGPLDAMNPLQRLARFLAESYGELAEILEGLRETRGLFRKAEMHRLQHTHITLQEVTSQTEMATTGMLDGLERCLGLVDTLESPAVEGEEDPRSRLRDELHQVIQHLQFQDITAQRIGHATGVLSDVETRLVRLMGTLEQYGFAVTDQEEEVEAVTEELVVCDPNATTANADSRQALADDIFA